MTKRKKWKVTIRVFGVVRQTVLTKRREEAEQIAKLVRPEMHETAEIEAPNAHS